ncbi:MAG: VWA domain-containing protein [Candidatus Omnitrophica bacterium]|nr:VWA domain-containing protein [Candidatus Omnitrophota bacterium]
MRFGAPYMAAWLWMVPAVIFFFMLVYRSRENIMRRFASSKLLDEISGSFSKRRVKIKNALIIIAITLILVALMRPQWGFQWQEVRQQGIDILIALDTSNSMLAEDVLPNRIDRAKLAIRDLVRKLHGDRVGLIAFAGTAFLQCPLTIDYDGFLLSLNDVSVNTIPVGGTSLARAIYTAINSYEGGKKEHKILIVITDGEDLEGGVDEAIQAARANGIEIFCVGIGSQAGELIPMKDNRGKQVFLKDAEGNMVKTYLNEGPLQKMAIETGGMYIRASGAEFGLDLIYNERLSKLEKQDFKSKMEKRYHERFQYPLGFVLLLLFIEPLVGNRKKESKRT